MPLYSYQYIKSINKLSKFQIETNQNALQKRSVNNQITKNIDCKYLYLFSLERKLLVKNADNGKKMVEFN